MLRDAELREISHLSKQAVENELNKELSGLLDQVFGQMFRGQMREQRQATRRVEVRQVDSLEELMRLLSSRK